MNRSSHIAIASILLVLGGCAGRGDDVERNQAALPFAADSALAGQGALEDPEVLPVEQPAAVEEPADDRHVELSLTAFDALSGEAIADTDVCRVGFEVPRGYAMAGNHAPAMFPDDDAMECGEAGDDGANVTSVREHTEVLLAAYAPGYPFYALHLTSGQDDASTELSLLSDEKLDAIYAELGAERREHASSIVVETPADGLKVSLLRVGYQVEAIAPATYLDAKGALSDVAVTGGKALFTNVPMGPYEVSFAHDWVRCSAYGLNGWTTPHGNAVWAIDSFEAYVGGVFCQR